MRRCLAALALLLLVTGCGAKAPDYQSIWTSSTTPTTKGRPVPIADYLEQQKVTGAPMTPQTLTEFTVSIPQPPGWTVVTDPNQPTAFEILRKTAVQAVQPTATLMVFKLMGEFNVSEAIHHGYADAELSEKFVRLDASMDNFHGMPSSMIEGSYTVKDKRLHTYNRIVIPTGPPPNNQRYLVQFSITTAADQAQAQSADVETIIKGFTVTPK